MVELLMTLRAYHVSNGIGKAVATCVLSRQAESLARKHWRQE